MAIWAGLVSGGRLEGWRWNPLKVYSLTWLPVAASCPRGLLLEASACGLFMQPELPHRGEKRLSQEEAERHTAISPFLIWSFKSHGFISIAASP